ncbi:NACHT domain-containing protein [Actinoplanes sp. NPDC049316]|uniref:NACHT domain-containing protein n=1 Tax=Actinoplanes sp. NPDC049316 TaxID=3154727 RepID=UPI00341FEECD
MRRLSARSLSLAALLLSLAFALVGNIATSTVEPPESWRWFPWAAWALVAAVAAATVRIHIRQSPSVVVGSDAEVVSDLAARLGRVWSDEAVRREVTRPAPVLVSWSSTGLPSASREAVFGEPSDGGWQDFPLRGETDQLNEQIVELFWQLPRRQLMVLGAAGGGKSVFTMLLTLGLLGRRTAGEPVPLLLAIGEWNPAEPVATFVARRLADDFADVLARYGDPRAVAERLVEHERLLPILDGLDELPAREAALSALNAYADAGHPLVLTCRTREYKQLVLPGRAVLTRTAVVELQPVSVAAVLSFLSYPEPARQRWEPVFAHLRPFLAEPLGCADPLVQALSTPLMVSLARIAYQRPESDPAELLALSSPQAIATRLMTDYVDAVGVGRSARRWLSCLSYYLYRAGTRDLHWWQIRLSLFAVHPQRSRARTTAVAVAIAGVAAGLAAAAAQLSIVWSVVTGCLVTTAAARGWLREVWPAAYPPRPRIALPPARRSARIACGIVYGLGVAAATTMISDAGWFVLPAGVGSGLLAVFLPGRRPRYPRKLRAGADPALVHNRRTALAVAVQNAVPAFFAAGTSGWLAGVVAAAVCGATSGLVAGGWAWAEFRLTHARLALTGWLPWRLGRFLRIAHRRGVLRRDGTVYQFRHAILQDHLSQLPRAVHLRNLSDDSDLDAALTLADLIAEKGDLVPEIAAVRPRRGDFYRFAEQRAAMTREDQEAVNATIDHLRQVADAGDRQTAAHLAEMLARHGRVRELQFRAQLGDPFASKQLVDLFAGQGRARELQAMADAGDRYAGMQLVVLFADRGRVADLRARAADGDDYAALHLARLENAEDSDVALRLRIATGDGDAVLELARRMAERGQSEDAKALLRPRADDGDGYAARQLDELLLDLGEMHELTARARAGDRYADDILIDLRIADYRLALHMADVDREVARLRTAVEWDPGSLPKLARLLADRGEVDEAYELLQPRVRLRDAHAILMTANLLVRMDRVEEALGLLRPAADGKDQNAVVMLVDLLADLGRVDELRDRAKKDGCAARALADLLVDLGRIDELRDRAAKRDPYAARRLVNLHVEWGDVRGLRQLAADGDGYATERLLDVLIDGRDVELLCEYIDRFTPDPPPRLVNLLADHGRVGELEKLARGGDWYATRRLTDVLVEQGNLELATAILRRQTELGDGRAARHLADLLAELGKIDEATAVLRPHADAGDPAATRRLAGLLAEQIG